MKPTVQKTGVMLDRSAVSARPEGPSLNQGTASPGLLGHKLFFSPGIGSILPGRGAGYDVVRIGLGVLLLTAAALKGHQLATEPVAETGLLTSRWFLIAVVEFELFFGLWLLAALCPNFNWLLSILWSTYCANVCLVKAATGESSCCGCFSIITANMWYTFALDICQPDRMSPPITLGSRWDPLQLAGICLHERSSSTFERCPTETVLLGLSSCAGGRAYSWL